MASIFEPVPSPSDKPQCLRGRRLDGAGIALRASVAAGERPNRMFLRLCRDPSHDEAAEWAGAGFEAAQARIELLASAMNGSSDYIVLVDRERMAHIDANEAATAFHGIDRDSLLRVPPWQISGLDGPEQLAAAYDRIIASAPMWDEALLPLKRMSGGEPAMFEVRRKALRVDGRWIIVVTARDVTERLRQQARMERFATALDLSEDAVFLVDRETMSFLDVNETACRLVGVPREKLLKRRPYDDDLLGPGRAELEAQYDQLIARSPAAETMEREVLRADGACRYPANCAGRRCAPRTAAG